MPYRIRMMDIEQIRVRIMSEAYDLADRGDLEGYNAIKVMCSDVLELIAAVVAIEREACAKVCEEITNELNNWPAAYDVVTAETKFIRGMGETIGKPFIEAIRARGKHD